MSQISKEKTRKKERTNERNKERKERKRNTARYIIQKTPRRLKHTSVYWKERKV